MYHIDHDWISKRVNGHGACYSYNSSNGLVFISWIYGVGRLRVFWYNIQLFFRYMKRQCAGKEENKGEK